MLDRTEDIAHATLATASAMTSRRQHFTEVILGEELESEGLIEEIPPHGGARRYRWLGAGG